jgi:hypothetical protein
MVKLHQIGKTIFTVYINDHLPPHFHVVSPEFEALIEIETLNIYAGSLGKSRRVRRDVMAWASANTAAIKAEWNRVNPRFPVK